ncbi:glycoside hydrolase family 43 protein [Macroventuria anomochaeta]|uniref:Glycoside hydrolase family 43 protein n=1 Tax=Macroventuria anomochaeta TaxID=301207 RepID=A0ACB6S4M6_9PLEO|nr:glycoside hydrolase family 43 protein [Macroventuria anomochaeta]KAF2629131.1 glycoside hydrolase family 43 protein [Macroventuria anomochaeta]
MRRRDPVYTRSLSQSKAFPFLTAMSISTLITLATVLPLLFRFGLTSPIPQGDTTYYPSPYPVPAPCYGNNSWIHDPSIIYEDGTYWRFSTSGNIAVATAPSIKGPWTYKGPLLPAGTKIRVAPDQDIWAPSISKFDDLYYIHYSVSTMGSQASQIGLATSSSLSGPWTDHGSLNLPQHPTYNLIDPYIFQDSPSDTLYFTFGSYWSGIQQFSLPSHNHLMALDGSQAKIQDIQTLVTNSTAGAAVVEGATTFKHDSFYYLLFSVGACCNSPTKPPYLAPPGDEYRVAVCRADAVTGPYLDKEGRSCKEQNGGTTILASHGDVYAPGGQGVMSLPGDDSNGGRDVIYYHYVKPSVGFEADQFFFGWNYLEWRDGWPVVV